MKYPKPLGTHILVRRKKLDQGIIITRETCNEGEIVAVGEGKEKEKMLLSVGQNVMFEAAYGLKQIPIADDKESQYLLMDQDDVLVILD